MPTSTCDPWKIHFKNFYGSLYLKLSEPVKFLQYRVSKMLKKIISISIVYKTPLTAPQKPTKNTETQFENNFSPLPPSKFHQSFTSRCSIKVENLVAMKTV